MRTLPSASVISSSEMLDSETRSTKVLSLRMSMMERSPGKERLVGGARGAGRMGELAAGGCAGQGELERQGVALGAESADHAFGEVGKIGMVPERLAAMDVRQMNLDERDRHGRERIAQRHAG